MIKDEIWYIEMMYFDNVRLSIVILFNILFYIDIMLVFWLIWFKGF